MRWIGGGVDRRNLELRRQGWYAVKDVPAKLVPLVGRKRLRVTLRTREHVMALVRRPAALNALERRIAEAAGQLGNAQWMEQALEVREALRSPEPVGWEVQPGDPEAPDGVPLTAADFAEDIVDHLTRSARLRGYPNPSMLAKVALGDATPIEPMVETWLGEQDIEERSKGDHRKALSELAAWCLAESITPALESFDRKTAGRYVSSLLARKMHRATLGKRLWFLSSLWRWLVSKGHADANPWRDQGVGKGGMSDRDKEPERAFTDAEVSLLLGGTTDRTLLDMARIAALSGLRVDEIARLTCRDVNLNERTMAVRSNPKTASSRRVVPIHSALLGIITARVKGKAADAFVIEELGPAPKVGRQRSMAFSKRFGTYRQSVGVHAKTDDQRRSCVNFHSFRRYFVIKAEQAGQPETIIRAVVGHKRAGMTLGTYSAGPSLEQRRACVEAMRLPSTPAKSAPRQKRA